MNGKKAKKLRRISNALGIGKTKSEKKKIYKRLKTIKNES